MPDTSPTEPSAESPTEPSAESPTESFTETPTESAVENGESASKSGSKPRRRGAGGRKLRMPALGEATSRWLTFAALVIALIALGLAIVPWFHPLHEGASSKTFNDVQTSEAKQNVCTAYMTIKQAVIANTHMQNPGGDDPIGALAVAANARLALLGSGVFLRDRLAAEPATSSDLKEALNSMANTVEELGINYLAGASSLVQDPLREDLNAQIAQVDQMCGG